MFTFTEDQLMMQKMVREFAEKELDRKSVV